jgi:hypothetical protein
MRHEKGGGEVNQVIRWCAAGLITAAVFSAGTVICGLLVLPLVLRSLADRWVVASALGVAVAALAALWGASWAEEGNRQAARDNASQDGPEVAVTGGEVSFGGDNYGIVSTGDHAANTSDP